MMATNVATALEIERENHIRPVTWDEWITLPIREQDEAVQTVRGPIRVPTVIVAVNYAKVPKKRPKLCAKPIRERDNNRCQYTGRVLRPDEGSLDASLPIKVISTSHMTNRRHLKCASCGTKVITRTAIGHGSYQEYAFPCPSCSVEIRYALELDQSKPSFEYAKLVNADWIDGDSAEVNLHLQDESIQHVRTFDSETLVPLALDRNLTAFVATCWLPKDIHQFRRHQSARLSAVLGVRPEIEKLLIHFDNRNWPLFDKQAATLDFGDASFEYEVDRLRFVLRVLEQYGMFFRPGTDALAQMIRQRINIAESSSPSAMAGLLSYFVKSGKGDSLWAEVEGIRKRWPRIFP